MTFRKIGEPAVHTPMRRTALLFMTLLFFVSVTAFAVPPMMYDVTINDSGNVYTVSVSDTEPGRILEKAGITLNTAYGDRLNAEGFTPGEGGTLVISRGKRIAVTSFDGTYSVVYASGTVADALSAAGITLKKYAKTSYSLETELTEGMEIEIYDIYEITVKVDGKIVKTSVSGKTVEDALACLSITLGEKDYTKPAVNTALKNGMSLTVCRVTTKARTAKESVPYETDYSYTEALYKNHTKIVNDGKNGVKTVEYTDYYVNGKLSKSVSQSEKILTKPVNKTVQVGTKVNPYPTSLPTGSPISELAVPSYVNVGSNGVPTSYKSVINGKATAYCIPGGTTSTGKRAQTGYIAVDPREIPYGTEMYIVSADGKYVYGYCIAADTGGFIYDVDWTVDLYMNSIEQCCNWGRRDIIIYVL